MNVNRRVVTKLWFVSARTKRRIMINNEMMLCYSIKLYEYKIESLGNKDGSWGHEPRLGLTNY
jgi:hypothetical protein